MGYLMEVDENDNARFLKHGHKRLKKIDIKKYKRISNMKKKSKSKNYRRKQK